MPPSLIFLYLVKIKYVEKITNPLATKIMNQPKYSDKNNWVTLNNSADAERFVNTIKVIIIKNATEDKNLTLLRFFIKIIYLFFGLIELSETQIIYIIYRLFNENLMISFYMYINYAYNLHTYRIFNTLYLHIYYI